VMLQADITGRLEQHVEDGAFGWCEQHGVDEALAFAATTVASDVLDASTVETDVEDARVRGVHQVQANDLADLGLLRQRDVAVDQHDVAEATHGRIRGSGATE